MATEQDLKAISILMKENILPNKQNIQILTQCDYDVNVFKNKKEFLNKSFEPNVEVLNKKSFIPKKIKSSDFVESFRARYNTIKRILMQRPEVQDAVSISRAKQMQEEVTIIAMVFDINLLNTGSYILEIEDLSGKYTAIASKNNSEVLEKIKYVSFDEVIALKGRFSKDIFFIKDIIWPDIPMTPFPKTDEEVYIVFSSDVHIGSNMFLEKKFNTFIKWLSGEIGDENQRKIAEKVKYIFFIGDLVDGVGVYPGQEDELIIKDLEKQFEKFSEYISKIPKDKKIILCPGNHDGLTIEEPQVFSEKYAKILTEFSNVFLVPNPCLLKLHKNPKYCGLKVLIYHGYSFDYFVDKVEFLRLAGGYDKADEIMKFLLKRRHLAPCYGSTLCFPMKEDPLIIKNIPHVLATGHIHKVAVGKYKGIHTICSSCWQAKTEFQEKVGHHPEPGKVPILNLKTGKVSILDFS